MFRKIYVLIEIQVSYFMLIFQIDYLLYDIFVLYFWILNIKESVIKKKNKKKTANKHKYTLYLLILIVSPLVQIFEYIKNKNIFLNICKFFSYFQFIFIEFMNFFLWFFFLFFLSFIFFIKKFLWKTKF